MCSSFWTSSASLLLFVGARRRLPARQQRAGGNDGAGRAALVGLGVEVPDAGIAEPVGVRIAGEHVGRDVGGQVPGRRVAIVQL